MEIPRFGISGIIEMVGRSLVVVGKIDQCDHVWKHYNNGCSECKKCDKEVWN